MVTPSAREALRKVHNPPNPWHRTMVEDLGPPPSATLEIFEDRSRSALSRNQSPDVGFEFSVNPYRGCYHGCAYCYARPTHEHLDFGAGTDFERKLVVKRDIASLLRAAFDKPTWRGDVIVLSGNTDCYQPLEASLGLTRACLQVCLSYRNPVGIITKSALVERDIDVLAALAAEAHCTVAVSLCFDDAELARAMEPGAPAPARRYKVIERLARAGVPVGLMCAPIIPGLNDSELPAVLTNARSAGAGWVGTTMLRLPGSVAEVFEHRVRTAFPLKAEKILRQIRACRGGKLTDARFGSRMKGEGERWKIVRDLVSGLESRLGYGRAPEAPTPSPFRRPGSAGAVQLALF